MAKRTIRDRRLTGDDNLTNILSGTTTGTGQVEQQDQKGSISGVPKDTTAPGEAAPTTTQSAQQQNQQQAQQQQVKIATKAPKQPARSGMFTNIKQYIEKNKPVVEKMGQQAGSQFATTAEKVKQKADIQQKGYQKRLEEAQKAVDFQIMSGQHAIDDALNAYPGQATTEVPETQETQDSDVFPTEVEQPATLADYGKSAEKLAESTSALNIDEQIKDASKLQKQASSILSDAGRKDLLRDVFGRGARQYTSGAQSLDNLLLAKSPEAGKKLKENIKSASRGLEDVVRQQQTSDMALKNLKERAAGVKDMLTNKANLFLEKQFKNLETSTEDFKKDRKSYLNNLVKKANEDLVKKEAVFKKIATYSPEKLLLEMGAKTSAVVKKDYLGRPIIGPSGGTAGTSYTLKESDIRNFYDNNNLDFFYGDYSKFRKALNLPKAGKKGNITVSDVHASYLPSGVKYTKNEGTDFAINPLPLLDFTRDVSKAVAKAKYGEDYIDPKIAKQIEENTGMNYYDLIKDSDIEEGKYYGYSDEEIARINALKKLLGKTDFITPSEDYISKEDLQKVKPPRTVGVVKPLPFRKR